MHATSPKVPKLITTASLSNPRWTPSRRAAGDPSQQWKLTSNGSRCAHTRVYIIHSSHFGPSTINIRFRFVISGNKHAIQFLVPRSTFGIVDTTLRQIEHDSQSGVRTRSRSDHSPSVCSPTACLTSTPVLVRLESTERTQIEISRKSWCSGVMVATHSILSALRRKTASLSFTAFERSTESELCPARNRS